MKKIFLICFFGILFSGYSKAQNSAYTDISLFTNLSDYTVTAMYDTIFTREVIITMNDTTGLQSLTVNLSLQTESGWQTQQTVTLPKSDLSITPCFSSLCFYRKNGNQWAIYLGAFPLNTRHKIAIYFSSLFTNTTNLDWEQEF